MRHNALRLSQPFRAHSAHTSTRHHKPAAPVGGKQRSELLQLHRRHVMQGYCQCPGKAPKKNTAVQWSTAITRPLLVYNVNDYSQASGPISPRWSNRHRVQVMVALEMMFDPQRLPASDSSHGDERAIVDYIRVHEKKKHAENLRTVIAVTPTRDENPKYRIKPDCPERSCQTKTTPPPPRNKQKAHNTCTTPFPSRPG